MEDPRALSIKLNMAITTYAGLKRDVSGSEDTTAIGLDVQDGVDSNTKPSLLTAAIREYVTVHFCTMSVGLT